MLAELSGEPAPPLPAIPGHKHSAPPAEAIDRRLESYSRAARFVSQVSPGWKGWRP